MSRRGDLVPAFRLSETQLFRSPSACCSFVPRKYLAKFTHEPTFLRVLYNRRPVKAGYCCGIEMEMRYSLVLHCTWVLLSPVFAMFGSLNVKLKFQSLQQHDMCQVCHLLECIGSGRCLLPGGIVFAARSAGVPCLSVGTWTGWSWRSGVDGGSDKRQWQSSPLQRV